MYSYPPEYLLHPVPVLALYGLTNTDETNLLVDVEPTETMGSPSRRDPTSRSGLANALLSIFTSKPEYTLYEATRYISTSHAPPFRVITVSKVKPLHSFSCNKRVYLIYALPRRIMFYLKNNKHYLPTYLHLIPIYHLYRLTHHYTLMVSCHRFG